MGEGGGKGVCEEVEGRMGIIKIKICCIHVGYSHRSIYLYVKKYNRKVSQRFTTAELKSRNNNKRVISQVLIGSLMLYSMRNRKRVKIEHCVSQTGKE